MGPGSLVCFLPASGCDYSSRFHHICESLRFETRWRAVLAPRPYPKGSLDHQDLIFHRICFNAEYYKVISRAVTVPSSDVELQFSFQLLSLDFLPWEKRSLPLQTVQCTLPSLAVGEPL